MLIEVQETRSPGAGKVMAAVIAVDGQKYEIYPEELAGIQVGKSYEVEVAQREYRGRPIRKITKATPVNGAAHPTANGNAPASAGDESRFVAILLAGMIIKGDVAHDDKRRLFDAANLFRGLYGATFGLKNGGATR